MIKTKNQKNEEPENKYDKANKKIGLGRMVAGAGTLILGGVVIVAKKAGPKIISVAKKVVFKG